MKYTAVSFSYRVLGMTQILIEMKMKNTLRLLNLSGTKSIKKSFFFDFFEIGTCVTAPFYRGAMISLNW